MDLPARYHSCTLALAVRMRALLHRGLCFQDQLELLIQNDVEKISADAALFILKHQIFGLLKSMQFDIQQTAWLLWINKQFTDG